MTRIHLALAVGGVGVFLPALMAASTFAATKPAVGKFEFICGERFITFPQGWVEGSKTPTRGLLTIRKAHVLSLQTWSPGVSATIIFRIGEQAEVRVVNLPQPGAKLLWARLVTCLD